MGIMELNRLYNEFDKGVGFIDRISFKRLLNMLELPINNDLIHEENNMDDVMNYIKAIPDTQEHIIKVNVFKEKLSEKIGVKSTDHLLKEYNSGKIGRFRINISRLLHKMNLDDVFKD
jgi:hypothetical protein